MDNFLKMDIFFVVSTLAVVVLAVLLAVALIRVLRILKKVDQISDIAIEESEHIRDDIDEVRASVKDGASRIGQLLGLAASVKKPKRRTRKS